MKSERKIQCLVYLDVQVFEDRLMLINAKGYSENEHPGVPKLVPTYDTDKTHKSEILEMDFVNQPIEDTKKEKVDFDIKVVIDLGKISGKLKGIKVIAESNADIVLIS